MTEIAIQFLVERLSTLLSENVKMVKHVRQDIEYVQRELERITAFLRLADAVEDMTNPHIGVWVKQVRDLSYEIEDIIDKFMPHTPDTNSCSPAFIQQLVFRISNIKTHYQVATSIQAIKTKTKEIDDANKRYVTDLNFPNQGPTSCTCEIDGRGDALLLEEDELVGIEHPKEEVIAWLVGGDLKLKVVAVVGMGGLGKTTLVKKVFDDSVVKKHFQNYAWITISQSFKMDGLDQVLKDIIQQLYDQVKIPVPAQDMTNMARNKLKVTIKNFLRQKRYLLVFDDLWSIEAWEAIKHMFPNEDQGSRVILTTRSMTVASSCSIETKGYVYQLKPLSESDSWMLFCRKAFHGSSNPKHLTDISENILRRCGGLPLAIVAMSRVLSTETNVDQWRMLKDGLGSEFEGNDQLESMNKILLLSFNYLPYYLKPCYMYLSNYPEDYLIGHNTLVRQWIAEGFVKQNDRRTVEEVAHGYLNELVNRSLLCPVKINADGSVHTSRIHDLYRDIILSKSRDQNFVTTTAESNLVCPKRVRRLSVHRALKNEDVKRYGVRLCSLLLFNVRGHIQSTSSITQLLKSSKKMKVLDLTGLLLKKFPEVILELLHLRYLCLRNTGIKKLPGSIKKLQKLEMLDLKGTYINELPDGILKLQYLRHLLVYRHVRSSYLPYNHRHGFKALKGMGCLKSLQKISLIQAYPGSDVLEEIAKMTELKRISIYKLRNEDSEALCSAITNLTKLRSLGVRAVEGDVLDLQYIASPPPLLQRVYLGGRLAKFPRWVQSLPSLVKICLRWSSLSDDPLQYLQDLPNLVRVELLDSYVKQNLCFKAGKFQKLKLIDFDRLEALKSIIIEEGATPLLEKLIIQRCNVLESVPEGIERLSNLKVVEFFDMPEAFISPLCGDEYGKIAHIPEVNHTYWRNGFWEVYPLYRCEKSGELESPAVTSQEQRNCL